MERPFLLNGESVRVTASVGGVWGDRGQVTAVSMLRDADAAMYAAKSRGQGLLEVFDDDASLRSLEHLDMRSDLQLALDRDQYSVYYQPIFDLVTNRITAFEALLRWHHPTRGSIPPDLFIPLAEETGDIIAIGNWVLTEACQRLAAWQCLPDQRSLVMSVNVSPLQLREPAHAIHMLDLMCSVGVDPASVWLEVTEHGSLHNDVQESVTLLRAAGAHFSLDDFGISYSNLNHLRQIPVECLKIDRSFVAGLTAEGNKSAIDQAAVRAILAIGDSLNLTVIAEGVDTAQQQAALTAMGCRLGQGFLLSEALPAADAVRLLQDGPLR